MEYTRSFTQENINVVKRKKFGNQTARVEVTPFDPAYGVEHLLAFNALALLFSS